MRRISVLLIGRLDCTLIVILKHFQKTVRMLFNFYVTMKHASMLAFNVMGKMIVEIPQMKTIAVRTSTELHVKFGKRITFNTL